MSPVAETTEAGFDTDVLKSAHPVVVDFWAPWCGPCRMMAPIVEKTAVKFDGAVDFRKLNTDENEGVARNFGIMAIPTLIIFSAGREVDRVVGLIPAAALESKIKDAIART